jgi:hypothetical protein
VRDEEFLRGLQEVLEPSTWEGHAFRQADEQKFEKKPGKLVRS